jgi:Transposase IS200 like
VNPHGNYLLTNLHPNSVGGGKSVVLIRPEFKEDLYKYITGIVRNQGQKLISIKGMPDHVHILIGLKTSDGARRLGSGDKS